MALSIYKRGNIYWIRGTVRDRRICQTLSTRNRKVASKRAEEFELVADDGVCPMRWREMRDRFMINYSGQTAKQYSFLFKALEAHFIAKAYPHEVTLMDLEEFVHRKTLKPNTTRLEIAKLRAIWHWASDHRIVSSNVARKLRMPTAELGATRPLAVAELVALEDAIHAIGRDPSLVAQGTAATIHARTWAMYQILRTTGLRVSDLIRLRPENIVDGHVVIQTQKYKNHVRISLVEAATAAVAKLTVRPSGYYFWSGRAFTVACSSVGRTFRRLGLRAGIRGVYPHRFRDTFSVNLLAAGADLRLVSQMLGHRTIRATERHYAPWVKAFQDQADTAVRVAELAFQSERKQIPRALPS